MTEAEYVQAIRNVAEGYLEVIREPLAFVDADEGLRRIRHWTAIKEKLSPHTAIQLCDLWLEKNGGETPQTPREDRQPQEEEKSDVA